MWKNFSIIVALSLSLLGCKADELEVSFKTSDLIAVKNGGSETAEFEAVFSLIGELNNESRALIDALENIVVKYISIDDFEIKTTDMGFKISIEGEIPILNDENSEYAYYISVFHSNIIEGSNLVQLKTGHKFEMMKNEMSALNFMLAPDAFHPTRFRLRGDKDIEVLAPAVQVDGQDYLMWRGRIGDRLSLSFSGGAYDRTGPGFFFR
jgi:hypothetical protein